MNNWQQHLRSGDPAHGADLDPDVAAEIRQAVTSEAALARPPRPLWRQPLALAAMAALVITSGVIVGQRAAPSPAAADPTAAAAPGGHSDRRQLQFATPGGTRIIWTFDPAFDLKETNP